MIVLLTLLVAVGVPPEYLKPAFHHIIYTVPVLALVLTNPVWVLGSALALLAAFSYRAGGGPYLELIPLLTFIVIIGGMILSRLAIDNVQRLEIARREAEAERARAETERARAEQQAEELVRRNAEQERLLDLIATLETPTITLADGVLLAPIVGTLDSQRARLLTSRLLQETSAQGAHHVIYSRGHRGRYPGGRGVVADRPGPRIARLQGDAHRHFSQRGPDPYPTGDVPE